MTKETALKIPPRSMEFSTPVTQSSLPVWKWITIPQIRDSPSTKKHAFRSSWPWHEASSAVALLSSSLTDSRSVGRCLKNSWKIFGASWVLATCCGIIGNQNWISGWYSSRLILINVAFLSLFLSSWFLSFLWFVAFVYL